MNSRVWISFVVLVMVAGFAAAPSWSADKPVRKKAKPAAEKKDADSATGTDSDQSKSAAEDAKKTTAPAGEADKLEVATFGQGCFWCAEAVFQTIKGVKSVVSGYAGGTVPNPTYDMVGTGLTGHAEVVEITFDPKVISYDDLLEVFWHSHDPTQLNRQGPDEGTQYRSMILYHSQEQKETAEKSKAKLRNARKVVTEIVEFTKFYPAEEYHQNYFKNHPENPYCYMTVRPKVLKAKKLFKDKVAKPEGK